MPVVVVPRITRAQEMEINVKAILSSPGVYKKAEWIHTAHTRTVRFGLATGQRRSMPRVLLGASACQISSRQEVN
jgi:hypothetical protein